MHDKLLHRAGGRLTHRHDTHPSSSAAAATRPEELVLDPAKVRGLGAGTLGPHDEAALALEVAELLPHGWDLPYKLKAALQDVIAHLGSEADLMKWLDAFPGRPRLTARVYAFLGLLDHYGDAPEVVDALRDARTREPYPAGLRDVLVPQTDTETLSDMGYRVEALLADGNVEQATTLALAIADWLRRSLTGPAADLMGHARADIAQAAGEAAVPRSPAGP
ncbi:hypothetical protein OG946_35910 [Streptomyces sp. NBC_01808]|uniref:hypothetical protein n=1 Tax=Streptomyces sp. NBC_01808 TaxID=2975947 RepID=UPI002DD840D7|nr:hypothetical protein [Streptomyces sp. NBC_01808]WSA35912.1 hypothetical protein OG946_00080 [Streptomyces sp. NBC_01808]WSA42289.1 hypothetical protein OG946_35910 [Streptomyces sp. NBC_01808]